jgi:MinD superfamily P-loop ATPase
LPVSDISTAIDDLYALGARNVLVMNMYNLGDAPLGKELEAVNTPVPTSIPEPNQLAGVMMALGLMVITRSSCIFVRVRRMIFNC